MARIVRFDRFGGPDVLHIVDEDPRAPEDGEIRLTVAAMGLNRAEIMFREGAYVAVPGFPARIGIEASGTVDAIGPNVEGLAVGDRVCAIPIMSWDRWNNWTADSVSRYGVYGESAIVPAWSVARTPDKLSEVEAAAIWCQYLTAWGGLIDYAGVGAGDIVLVTAGSSSAALGGIQIAKQAGATVIVATRTDAKKEFLSSTGADHVVVTDTQDLASTIMGLTDGRGFTVAYDPVGGGFMADLAAAAQPCATIVAYGNLLTEPINVPTLPFLAKRLDVKFHSLFDVMRISEKRQAGIAYVDERVRGGVLKVIVDRTFPLDQIVDAHRYMESNQQRGKIVVVNR